MDSCPLSEGPLSSKGYTGLCDWDRSLVDLVDCNKSGSGWQLPKDLSACTVLAAWRQGKGG